MAIQEDRLGRSQDPANQNWRIPANLTVAAAGIVALISGLADYARADAMVKAELDLKAPWAVSAETMGEAEKNITSFRRSINDLALEGNLEEIMRGATDPALAESYRIRDAQEAAYKKRRVVKQELYDQQSGDLLGLPLPVNRAWRDIALALMGCGIFGIGSGAAFTEHSRSKTRTA